MCTFEVDSAHLALVVLHVQQRGTALEEQLRQFGRFVAVMERGVAATLHNA